jgi:hypothetical protein
MPYKVLHHSNLEELVERDDSYSGVVEGGLNAMEKSGWTLVQVVPEQSGDIPGDVLYVFHRARGPEDVAARLSE